ncbi:DUF4114 domain-containing protein [Haloferula sargassicola]|uniref:DUF4114 domain-containing protein n=1 Tax=Haloferula sargassicola TaxID=490096 RepID=A0ABP9UT18_9BACT
MKSATQPDHAQLALGTTPACHRSRRLRAAWLAVLAATVPAAEAQTQASYQDPARPFGLSPVGPVMAAGSDETSASFQLNDLPNLLKFVNTNLSESKALTDVSAVALDPQALTLGQESTVRVYFLSEGAGYRNTLGYTTENITSHDTSEAQLIFPDASSDNVYSSNLHKLTSKSLRNNDTPLVPGDFVDLGTIGSATLIDFFLIADGANYGGNIYGADSSSNPDLIQHVVAFALEGSPYLLMGFEDMYNGGDLDFNDLVIAIDIGAANVARLANPEPAFWLMMAALAGAGWWFYRRNPTLGSATAA